MVVLPQDDAAFQKRRKVRQKNKLVIFQKIDIQNMQRAQISPQK